jgi:hypothetical protein
MGSVSNPAQGAWVSQGPYSWVAPEALTKDVLFACACRRSSLTNGSSLGVTVPWYLSDWFYVVLTIVVFAFLLLVVKGIETFER